MSIWTREDTHDWVIQLENRLDDMSYYLGKTLDWCDNNGIYQDQTVFVCSFMTCVWVSHMREEPITYKELVDILGIEDPGAPDKIYQLGPKFCDLDHEEMLRLAIAKFPEL